MTEKPTSSRGQEPEGDEQRVPEKAAPKLPAEPRYAIEITMSHAEQEALRAKLRKRFH